MLLLPAYTGASDIVNELSNLTDEKIKSLLNLADNYQLGEHKLRAQAILKSILVLTNTYFVFAQAKV